MLRVNLGQLEREGSVVVDASVPTDDGLWEDTDLRWADPVDVHLRVALAGTGEIVARGNVRGTLRQECRRCLRELEIDFATDLTMVFVAEDADVEDGGDAYTFEPTGAELDLSPAVREELILAINPYVVCDPDCRGLCPRCGADLNEGPCGCSEEETDPRWAALRDIKSE